MFVKWSCGCRGMIVEQNGKDLAICVEACDHSWEYGGSNLAFHSRHDNLEKSYTELSTEEGNVLMAAIDRAIADGDRFNAIKNMLS